MEMPENEEYGISEKKKERQDWEIFEGILGERSPKLICFFS